MIQPKFKINQDVWFMKGNTPQTDRIVRIDTVTQKGGNGEKNIDKDGNVTKITYNLYKSREYSDVYLEDFIFATKEDLLKAL